MASRPAAIRPATAADAVAIAGIYASYVVSSTASFEAVAPAPDEIARRMAAPPRLPWFIAARAHRPVGYCYASPHRSRPAYRWSIESSVYLAEDERGRGTGPALYDRLLAEVAALGYVTAFAGITLPNPASVRLHEDMGFTPIGVFANVGFKHGAWRDVGWWQRTLRDLPAHPDDPRPWEPAPPL